MLIGYVSDEKYVALADVVVEFTNDAGESWEARSRASGSIHAELPPGEYLVTLAKPGFGSKRVRMTPQWQPHHFRLLSDGLLGYAWPKCVRSGASSEFRVHSVEPYKLDLWRFGWDKEFIRALGWHDEHGPRAVMQIAPDGDYTRSGVGWNKVGYLSPHHLQKVEAPAKSGLYYFHASTAKGDSFTFPWVVAPAAPTAPIAVLASNITWNAYNNFGGRSNYINADELPAVPTINARQDLKRYHDAKHQTWGCDAYAPLSFERPEPINHIDPSEKITDPIEGRAANHIAPAEWRALGWLEREGFAYDLYSETQLHEGVLDLTKYRVLILVAHPEYWTRTMYDTVKAWVTQQKGRLMYLGGNGLNCEVELLSPLPPGDGSGVRGGLGAMICHNTKISSLYPDGMGGAESRFARRHESEANLLGVVFDPRGIMTAAPYRVIDSMHWVFAGTGLRVGHHFGQKSLHMRCPGGASGHETDKISKSSPKNVHLLAKGLNPDDGGAEMVIFDTPSGGAVFSVGSICWPSSLPIDDNVSKITANVLRRFLQ
ncbi:MAG: carboxypeptidase regulatory-like domain-containing protein [Planctomycetes bacterium]|nr:carboxypeptidase regulatory-like domain-containing protein [Planctomycetota bacterium]